MSDINVSVPEPKHDKKLEEQHNRFTGELNDWLITVQDEAYNRGVAVTSVAYDKVVDQLLEALREIERYLVHPETQFAVPMIDIVRAAIAAAEGGDA